MTEFEKVLQDCLLALEHGTSLGECLSRYPQHALALEPVLLTSLDLERGREARPSDAFKRRVRSRLTQEMKAHPRKSTQFRFMFARMATSFAVILLAFLIAGTAYAQGTMPGNAFYSWKLTSEIIWRSVASDPVSVDLAIANRRAAELISLGDNSEHRTQILEAYLQVVARLQLEINADNAAHIRSVLDSQIEELNESGILLPEPDQDPVPTNVLPTLEAPTLEAPTAIPTATPFVTVPPVISDVNPTLPISTTISTPNSAPIQKTVPVNPTDVPKIVPTVEVKTDIVPTIQVPSLIP